MTSTAHAHGHDRHEGRLADATTSEPEPFEALADALTGLGARRAHMMGRPMLAVGGRMFACLDAGVLGVRLGAGTPEHDAALELAGAALFSPGGRGRTFRDWVGLPSTADEHWLRFATAAMHRSASPAHRPVPPPGLEPGLGRV